MQPPVSRTALRGRDSRPSLLGTGSADYQYSSTPRHPFLDCCRLFIVLTSCCLFFSSLLSWLLPPRSGRIGSDRTRAQEVSTRLAKYDNCFVDAMVADGVGSFATPLDEGGSIREGLVTFAAFAASGVLPLLVYALSPLLSSGDAAVSPGTLFFWACLVTAAALFAIGVVKVR